MARKRKSKKSKRNPRAVTVEDKVLYAHKTDAGYSMKLAGGKPKGRVKHNADGSWTAYKGSKKISTHQTARKAKGAVRIATGTRAVRGQSNVGARPNRA